VEIGGGSGGTVVGRGRVYGGGGGAERIRRSGPGHRRAEFGVVKIGFALCVEFKEGVGVCCCVWLRGRFVEVIVLVIHGDYKRL